MELIRSGTTEKIVFSFHDSSGDPIATLLDADVDLYICNLNTGKWYDGTGWDSSTTSYAAVSLSGSDIVELDGDSPTASGVYYYEFDTDISDLNADITDPAEPQHFFVRIVGPTEAADKIQEGEFKVGGMGDMLYLVHAVLCNRFEISTSGVITIYAEDGETELLTWQAQDSSGADTSSYVHKRGAPALPT